MSFSIAYAGNGNFTMTVDGKTQTFNLADLNTMLRMEQVEQYDTQIADQLKEIQATNMKRKQLNQLLSKMRQAKAEGRDDDGNESSWDGKGSLTFKLDGTDGTTRNLQGWMQYFGLTCVDVSCTGDQKTRDTNWDTNITAVKGLKIGRAGCTARGVATAATHLIVRFGFEVLGLTRVEIVVDVDNGPSLRVAEKVGAVREGVLRNRLVTGDRVSDAVMFSLVPEDLREKR
jgi:hypothetical protein